MSTHDITNQFQTAVKSISAGTLIKDDGFSLFEAVGGLELGDSKMDSGHLLPGESLEDHFDFEQPLLPEQLVWLMDQLLNREVAWLTGYPLSQTLFTSVHIDRMLWPDPKTLDECNFRRGMAQNQQVDKSHQILRAFCLLLIKSCDLVLSMVTSQHYYEEEDFTTQLFNRELLHRFSSQSVLEEVISVMEELQVTPMRFEVRNALVNRLRLRCDILHLLSQHAVGQTLSNVKFHKMQSLLESTHSSHPFGLALEEAFSTKLQRRLASTVPPRPMVTVSMERVWDFWRRMLKDCEDVFSVLTADHSQDLLTAYELFAFDSPQSSTYCRALLQSFLNINGMISNRLQPLDFLEEDLRSLTLPTSPLLASSRNDYGISSFGDRELSEYIRKFHDKMEHYFVTLYRAFCLNPCRIRRTFCHALIEWDGIQGELEEADSYIQSISHEEPSSPPGSIQPTYSYSFSSWVYHYKLSIHRSIIQMGFQQMIYASHEMAGMHWYLSSVCEIHLNHLERMCHFVMMTDTSIKTSNLSSATRARGAAECKQALDRLFRQYSLVKATSLLASTLHLIFVILRRWEVFRQTEPLYSNDELRHEIRMRPFQNLAVPDSPSTVEFEQRSTMSNIETDELIASAKPLSTQAKKAWEDIGKTRWHMYDLRKTETSPADDFAEEKMRTRASALDLKWEVHAKSCIRTSIAAGLTVLKLDSYVNDIDGRQRLRATKIPEPGEKERWHPWWIVPVLP